MTKPSGSAWSTAAPRSPPNSNAHSLVISSFESTMVVVDGVDGVHVLSMSFRSVVDVFRRFISKYAVVVLEHKLAGKIPKYASLVRKAPPPPPMVRQLLTLCRCLVTTRRNLFLCAICRTAAFHEFFDSLSERTSARSASSPTVTNE